MTRRTGTPDQTSKCWTWFTRRYTAFRIGHSSSYIRRGKHTPGADSVHVLSWEEYKSQRPDFEAFEEKYCISKHYQWLPTDFSVSESGVVEPLDFINNIHPVQHRPIYDAISSILSHSCLSGVLGTIISKDPIRQKRGIGGSVRRNGPSYPTRHLLLLDFKESMAGRSQVIVKLANIVLTPENPRCGGGSWNVEGMGNERIVGTGLYYYSSESISEPRLRFRATVGDAADWSVLVSYQQPESDYQGWYATYGFAGGNMLNQELGPGYILAEEDKCAAFPNIFQHRVGAFKLADPSWPLEDLVFLLH
ncbi:hypothetical protein GY45DRAFT_1326463 [Cubamyces sp. BRFM 1775]|nr:hypothetical protein GY45DRAFT_1326463 [Cubamyces sp. BRFM 1775]